MAVNQAVARTAPISIIVRTPQSRLVDNLTGLSGGDRAKVGANRARRFVGRRRVLAFVDGREFENSGAGLPTAHSAERHQSADLAPDPGGGGLHYCGAAPDHST